MTDIIPFDQRDGFIWYNGNFVPWKEAKVHVLNHGLHYASCVFEGERIYNGKIFKGEEHTKRLHASAQLMDFTIPYSRDDLNRAKNELAKKQGIVDGYMRCFAWRGSDKMAVSAQHNKIHVAIACWPWPPYYSEEARRAGLKLKFARYKRPSPETAPTAAKAAGLYMICTISKHEAERDGYNDALMLDYRGFLAEATGANLFLVMKNGELHTPLADCFLNGITRLTVIDLAKKRGIKVVERHIKKEELADAIDAFLTGSAAEITRISSVEDKYNYPQASQTTLDLMYDYNQLVRS
ncbi:MAG: branched-chain amino acid aminotransferase [Alphaproteobacteria bacterium RIFCSPLOWO2_01_FULL_40_26]|nr:MAG: branched-chain amino acid aminotransferase [Alphaproteobacteria bacterium RIFCSPHIGHO2_02_FULL_40_34]OFW94866.1 MAG: branched-chain amino acid aminotransferase [Alphaproteobacteria bacterium RIFCSPLOWO2_01_FULL_40_26]OFX10492.1 MAG: branched-chain amino acid aminotransferase [Alphaproteobacteria bacterium RIFCSPLOWO2_02_FULL_40_19]OFX10957.1 MAG: branched-chain amino acid aminotransferase [Alphaproteobacteria bacterium RIFCSPLOWO2_12_FULL_40_11]